MQFTSVPGPRSEGGARLRERCLDGCYGRPDQWKRKGIGREQERWEEGTPRDGEGKGGKAATRVGRVRHATTLRRRSAGMRALKQGQPRRVGVPSIKH